MRAGVAPAGASRSRQDHTGQIGHSVSPRGSCPYPQASQLQPLQPPQCRQLHLVSVTALMQQPLCRPPHAISMHFRHKHVAQQQHAQPRAGLRSRPRQHPGGLNQHRSSVHAQALMEAVGLPLGGPWGVWFALVLAGTFGHWSEKTRLGKELSGALVATLTGMLLVNIGVLPHGAAELKIVYKYILPLAIPMLLFSADLRRILGQTGKLLPAFFLGAGATVIGSAVAMLLFPLGQYMGGDGWRVAAALTARHIGGAVNYMSVCETLSVAPSTFSAGLAADDLILAIYFTTIYALAKSIPPDESDIGSPTSTPDGHSTSPGAGKSIQVEPALIALTISTLLCHLGTSAAATLSLPEQSITAITALTVLVATAVPKLLAPLVPSAEGLAQLLMMVFYATIGASANVALVIRTAPVLFLYSAIALGLHLAITLGLGHLLGFSRKELLLASNANIGGPSTVAGMAAAKGWRSSLVPSILTSTLGYTLGTFVGLALGHGFLARI